MALELRWDGFENELSRGLRELLVGGEHVDVTLACQGEYLKAHKNVLSVCSPYFREYFKENPSEHATLELHEMKLLHLQFLLQFMYRGEVRVPQRELSAFLKSAQALQIRGLSDSDTAVGSEQEEVAMVTETTNVDHDDHHNAEIPVEILHTVKIESRRRQEDTSSSSEQDPSTSHDNSGRRSPSPEVEMITISPPSSPTIIAVIPPPEPIPSTSQSRQTQRGSTESRKQYIPGPPKKRKKNREHSQFQYDMDCQEAGPSGTQKVPESSYQQSTKPDQKVEEVLKEWGFEFLIPKFEERAIDMEAFVDLPEGAICELIPGQGPRLGFMILYQELLRTSYPRQFRERFGGNSGLRCIGPQGTSTIHVRPEAQVKGLPIERPQAQVQGRAAPQMRPVAQPQVAEPQQRARQAQRLPMPSSSGGIRIEPGSGIRIEPVSEEEYLRSLSQRLYSSASPFSIPLDARIPAVTRRDPTQQPRADPQRPVRISVPRQTTSQFVLPRFSMHGPTRSTTIHTTSSHRTLRGNVFTLPFFIDPGPGAGTQATAQNLTVVTSQQQNTNQQSQPSTSSARTNAQAPSTQSNATVVTSQLNVWQDQPGTSTTRPNMQAPSTETNTVVTSQFNIWPEVQASSSASRPNMQVSSSETNTTEAKTSQSNVRQETQTSTSTSQPNAPAATTQSQQGTDSQRRGPKKTERRTRAAAEQSTSQGGQPLQLNTNNQTQERVSSASIQYPTPSMDTPNDYSLHNYIVRQHQEAELYFRRPNVQCNIILTTPGNNNVQIPRHDTQAGSNDAVAIDFTTPQNLSPQRNPPQPSREQNNEGTGTQTEARSTRVITTRVKDKTYHHLVLNPNCPERPRSPDPN